MTHNAQPHTLPATIQRAPRIPYHWSQVPVIKLALASFSTCVAAACIRVLKGLSMYAGWEQIATSHGSGPSPPRPQHSQHGHVFTASQAQKNSCLLIYSPLVTI
jgi:hypothetical protein